MITERYVTFETSKLLKEAGFDIPTRSIYRANRTGEYSFAEYNIKSTADDLSWNISDGFRYEYLAPTQSLAARWLREAHGIVVDVVFEPPKRGKDWRYFIGDMEDMAWAGDYIPSDGRYDTYEDALEAALVDILRRIIKDKEDEQRND